jgi:hypothetical protein
MEGAKIDSPHANARIAMIDLIADLRPLRFAQDGGGDGGSKDPDDPPDDPEPGTDPDDPTVSTVSDG